MRQSADALNDTSGNQDGYYYFRSTSEASHVCQCFHSYAVPISYKLSFKYPKLP